MESQYNLKDVVSWLLQNGYGLLVSDQFVITKKLNEELYQRSGAQDTALMKEMLPSLTDRKVLWNYFVMRAEIPHKVTSSIGPYTVRQYNVAAANRLMAILKDPSIDTEAFIAATKNYYKSMAGRMTISRYLASDVWRGEYEEYLKSPTSVVAARQDGSSRWED